jgi:hypothetical protein
LFVPNYKDQSASRSHTKIATETPIRFGLQHFVLSAIHREIPSLEESEIPLTSTAQFDLWAIHRENGPENNLNAPLNSLSGMPRSIRSLECPAIRRENGFWVKVKTLTRTTSTSLKASTSQKLKASHVTRSMVFSGSMSQEQRFFLKKDPRHKRKSNSLPENSIHFLSIFDEVL